MGTYRVEWPCCGDVTETEAWEPTECPFCAQPKLSWIDCMDKLPTPDVEVLGSYRGTRVSVFSFSEGTWFDSEDKPCPFRDVTHWMPVPDAP